MRNFALLFLNRCCVMVLLTINNIKMKQNEIIVGKKYLFTGQTSEAKKIMQNKKFTVVKIVKGKIKCTSNYRGNKGRGPNRYLLDNGMYANASNLKEIVVSTSVS